MLRIGLIGAGFMGDMHASCYKAIEGTELRAVSDASPERVKKFASDNVKFFENAYDLIASDEVDIVDICLPTYLHTQYAVEAMKSGKAVFIEKPVCMNEEEAALLVKTQEETGATVMVGQVIRFWDEYVWIKDAIESKKYGNVLSAVLKRLSPLPTWAWNNWLHNQQKSGGAALDMHIHDVDYIRYILGEPEIASSITRRDDNGSITQILVSYKFPSGAIGTTEACWDCPPDFPFCMEIRVKLEKATIVYNSAESKFVVYPNEGGAEIPDLPKVELAAHAGGNISSLGGYYNELKYFAERVSANKPIEVASLADSVESLKLALRGIALAD